jgi:hypothetical protein
MECSNQRTGHAREVCLTVEIYKSARLKRSARRRLYFTRASRSHEAPSKMSSKLRERD